MDVRQDKKEAGFTLIEVLVGMVVALMVVVFMLNLYLTNLRATKMIVSATRLDSDLRAVVAYISNDIRRAGYWAGSVVEAGGMTRLADPATNPFTSGAANLQASQKRGEAADSCLTFAYDRGTATTPGAEPDGILSANEYFAIRLNAGKVETKQSNSCDASRWQSLTDPDVVMVTELVFDLAGSGCMNVSRVSPIKVGAHCMEEYLSSTRDASSGDRIIQYKIVQITLSGRLVNDASVTKKLVERIQVRNPVVVVKP